MQINRYPKIKPDIEPEFRPDGLPIGWCCGDSKKMLKSMIDEIKPSVIAEFGSFKGMSAYYMAENCDAKIYCIDHWKGSPEHEKMNINCKRLYDIFIVNTWKYRERIHIIKRDTVEGMCILNELNIIPNMMYIDAGHDYQSVYKDVSTALSLFGVKANICGDDYTLDEVKRAVNQIVQDFKVTLVTGIYNNRCWRIV